MLNKVSFIGAGDVGSEAAFLLAHFGLTSEIVLIDLKGNLAEGRALDISHSLGEKGNSLKVVGGSDYALTENSDVVVITAGIATVSGEYSRDKMTAQNIQICQSVVADLAKYNHDPIVIMVSNPVDVLTTWAHYSTNFSRNKIIGFGNILDSMRYSYYSNTPAQMVIGEHGNNMILSGNETEQVRYQVANSAKTVVDLLENRSTMFAPAVGINMLLKAIANDTQEIMPVSAMFTGQFGISGICMGLPCKIGRSGIVSIEANSLKLSDTEQARLAQTADKIKQVLTQV